MRLVFAGTPEFARVALVALHAAGHDIVAVFTQPDRAAGRGLTLAQSPVKQEASRCGLLVVQPQSLRSGKPGAQEAVALLQQLQPDLMVVAAYGLLLPQEVLDIPRLGCINIHASLLPRWRGAAPIQRALAAGDTETGIALMQMEAGLDTGPVWSEVRTAITPRDNAQTLHDRLATLGAQSIVELLKEFPKATTGPRPQPSIGVTYAAKVTRDDLPVDWSQTADQVCCHIRAFDPSPGAQSRLENNPVKVLDAHVVVDPSADFLLKNVQPGQIIRADQQGLWVACGKGAVALGALQRSGGKRLGFREFLNGRRVTAGQIFESIKE
ncbi:MAG: methionyl-tRNA formyltransferase [Burkholderiaceae bacterium]